MKFLYFLLFTCYATPTSSLNDCNPDDFINTCDELGEVCHEGKCIDGCEVMECGINAECAFDIIHFCNCLEGYAGDPKVKCEKDPCKKEPCGRNATCFIDYNQVQCQCYEGMIGDPLDACWKAGDDICEPNPCGKNSRCIKEPEPGCLCLPGFYDQPPRCREGCGSDSECKDNEFCSSNACKVGCRSDESCKSDEYCDNIDHKCLKGCRSEENCKEKEFCNLDTRKCMPGCVLHKDCEEGHYCHHSINNCLNSCDGQTCGPNSKCKTIGHSRNVLCSCDRGYIPKSGVGCVKKREKISPNNLDCSKYCAKYSECSLIDEKVHCRCPDEIYGDFPLNPFKRCLYSPPPPVSAFANCAQAIKPECAVPISPQLIAVLAG